MPNRKIAMINSDNVVSLIIVLNEENLTEQGLIAGLLSSPECLEVESDSEASMGWKYINGVEYAPDTVEERI